MPVWTAGPRGSDRHGSSRVAGFCRTGSVVGFVPHRLQEAARLSAREHDRALPPAPIGPMSMQREATSTPVVPGHPRNAPRCGDEDTARIGSACRPRRSSRPGRSTNRASLCPDATFGAPPSSPGRADRCRAVRSFLCEERLGPLAPASPRLTPPDVSASSFEHGSTAPRSHSVGARPRGSPRAPPISTTARCP